MSGKNHSRRTPSYTDILYEKDDPRTYFDDPLFISYRDRIQELMRQSKAKGITTADIHKKFGTALRHWTMDALDWLDTEEVGACPTRYRCRNWYAKPVSVLTTNRNAWVFREQRNQKVFPLVEREI